MTNDEAYNEGKYAGTYEECVAVVEWLRKEAKKATWHSTDHLYRDIANRIAVGEHRKKVEDSG